MNKGSGLLRSNAVFPVLSVLYGNTSLGQTQEPALALHDVNKDFFQRDRFQKLP